MNVSFVTKRPLSLFAVICALVLSGCATGSMDYSTLSNQMSSGDCAGAAQGIRNAKDDYGNGRRLIYHMDLGIVNLLCGNYKASSRSLGRADTLAEKLWTKSVSKEAASFLINDMTVPYRGEDFERVFINLIGAMSYAANEDYDEALVEVRRLNGKLVELSEKYKGKRAYSEDAFVRYLGGLLYEAVDPADIQSLDSAYIDYYNAYKTYKKYEEDYGTPLPKEFMRDLLRVAEATGRLDELEDEAKDMQWVSHKDVREMGRIVLLHFAGNAPRKVEDAVFIETLEGPIKLAFPRFVVTPPACKAAELVVRSPGTQTELSARTELVEDINAIAVRDLEDRKVRVTAKALARAVAKQAAINAVAGAVDDEGAKLLAKFTGKVLAAVTEFADTRSWSTLPGEVHMVRSFVPPGKYNVTARLCGSVRDLGEIELGSGQTRVLIVDTMF